MSGNQAPKRRKRRFENLRLPTRDARVGNKAYKSVNLLIVGFGDSPNHPGEIRGGSRCGPLAATSLVRNFEGIMAAAAAFLNPTYESPSRDEVLARYRRLREIGAMHCSRATAFLSADAVLRQSRRLGLDRDGPPRRTRIDDGP